MIVIAIAIMTVILGVITIVIEIVGMIVIGIMLRRANGQWSINKSIDGDIDN